MFHALAKENNAKAWLATAVILVILSLGGIVTAVSADSLTGGNHNTISIRSNNDFTPPGSTSGCACVTGGSGTKSDPYIIGPWTIMATSDAPGVAVDGTGGAVSKFFILSHITVHGTSRTDGVDLISINGMGVDAIQAANIDSSANGILLRNTSGVTITGNSLNNNQFWGIKLT